MSVDIAVGDGFPQGANTGAWDWTTAVENVAIGAASANNRRDLVVAYTDLSVTNPSTSTPNNPGALKFIVVPGTPASSPSDPNDAAIRATAVGATNPYLILARVSLTSSTTQITNAQITSLITPIAFNVQRLWGGASNTLGHLVPNQADGTLVTTSDLDTVTDTMLDYPRWWQEIGRTTLVSAGDTITISSFPARKYLRILISVIATGGTIGPALRFNNDSGTSYGYRYSDNFGGAGSSGAGTTSIPFDAGAVVAYPFFVTIDAVNISAQEKILIGHSVGQNTAGAANYPVNKELMGKWANTSNQITRVDVINPGAGDFAVGSEAVVLGHD
jgi:hypothetical protein